MAQTHAAENYVRERTQVRRVFSRTAKSEIITDEEYSYLEDKAEHLLKLDKLIHEIMLSAQNFNEEAFEKEYDACEEYQSRWRMLRAAHRRTEKQNINNRSVSQEAKSTLRLPKLEIRQFDDNPKNWLAFWSQFQKIDVNEEITSEDKLQYLLQAMTEGSQARNLVSSYPATKENYDVVLQTLKNRYGREEVLIEIYIRELLQLVLNKNTMRIDSMYDKISVNLQILESLGIAKGKYEHMLLPMIESTLPDKLLIQWSKVPRSTDKSKLNQLLEFLRIEVDAEKRCKLARFELTNTESVPTAACLLTKEVKGEVSNNNISHNAGKNICYFCEKAHNSIECNVVNNISLEERKEAIRKKGGCYICLKRGHMAKTCRAYVKCLLCNKRHFFIMCPNLKVQRNSDQQNKNTNITREVASNLTNNNKTTLLQTLIVKISNNNQEIKVRALLDSGSQRSYVQTKLINELGLKVIGNENLAHSLFGGVKKEEETHRVIELQVGNLDSTYQIKITALEQDVLCGSLPKVQDNRLIKDLKKYKINLTDQNEDIVEISLLLGSDYLGSILENNFIHLSESLIAIPTKLGWTLQGPIQGVMNTIVNTHCISMQEDISLEFMWNIETLGIKDPYKKVSDNEVLNSFYDNISVNQEGRYEVRLLWKQVPEVKSNYENAYRRLMSTTKRLENIGKLEGYNEVFKEWLKEGIIEVVKENKKEEGHYLPHHAVVKMESCSTKIRPVFDASCKDVNKISLNAQIEKGINLIEVIPKLLIMFRAGAHGVISDIRKAFLQIAVNASDRKYLKLLWWSDLKTKQEIVTYQHTRVPFGVACSPFLLAATINYHLEKYADTHPETAKRLKECFYVDNCVTSFDTETELNKFKEEATQLLKKGKFELTYWMSNVKDQIIENESVSVLGVQWNRKRDDLCCVINLKTVPKDITKRDLLSITQQIFDPIGFLSPVTLVPRLIIQKVWMLNTGWDEKIPTELEQEYRKWISTIDYINKCKVPRRLADFVLQKCKVHIHVFCDASKDAYAGCIFLRAEYKGQVTVRLITAKSRVAPIKKQMTLPRLELMGALIASRLYKEVKASGLVHTCKDYKTYCWTDSAVVLAWLKRQETWKTFVTNRVKEICMNTDIDLWNHVPGIHNPADLPSRGCSAQKLVETLWWSGPHWLHLEEKEWPKTCLSLTSKEEEMIACEQGKNVTVLLEINIEDFSNKLLYFNKYTMIVRLVARLLRISPRIRKEYNITTVHIGYDEYKNAEEILIKIIQKEICTDKSKNKNLITIEEKGILKVKTRLEYSKEELSFIYPILLPGKNEIVKRMVLQKHKEMNHAGSLTMMTTLRNNFWITGIRKLTKKVVAECKICKRFTAKHYKVPEPPLPKDRIGNNIAFEVTGIDLAGPLILKNNKKVWIVLFTCAVYRAIHLELTDSVSTTSFMMTLRRFISRRGRPKIIYTDNGTNFVGTANLLKQVDWQEIENSTNCYSIKWKFSIPTAPWWGGWWERLVRVVKDMLRRILGKASIDWIELSTILCDCEAVINNRPLTVVGMEDMTPLTPAMFMQGLSTTNVPDLDQIDSENLKIRFRYLQHLRYDFRTRFKNEYLGLLVAKKRESGKEPKVGEIVLIESGSKRINWPIGVITEIFTGKDGYTRSVKVRTGLGEKVRPYQRLFPLEISAASQEWLSKLPKQSKTMVPEHQQPESTEDNNTHKESVLLPQVTTTRSGREIKLPHRFFE